MEQQPNNPLHGVKLADTVTLLESVYGFEEMGEITGIHCFMNNLSIKSSLKFLRQTPWATEKLEKLYLKTLKKL